LKAAVVSRATGLFGIEIECACEGGWMWSGQDAQAGDAIGMMGGCHPCHLATPVVTDEVSTL